jgi:hypothetical protein
VEGGRGEEGLVAFLRSSLLGGENVMPVGDSAMGMKRKILWARQRPIRL